MKPLYYNGLHGKWQYVAAGLAGRGRVVLHHFSQVRRGLERDLREEGTALRVRMIVRSDRSSARRAICGEEWGMIRS
jgi:hypothetical protein